MKQRQHTNQQSGMVSLFTVLFTTLLLTVITVGFIRLMLQEQRQAMNNDLSQSAYDSAISGVEDAKRVLRACRNDSTGTGAACAAINAEPKTCDTIQRAGVVGTTSDTEVTIKSGSTLDQSLSQSYTCVKIDRNSVDVLGNLTADGSQVIPLKSTLPFNQIVIEWMHKGSQYAGGNVETIVTPAIGGGISLPQNTDAGWGKDAPALLRVQAVLPADANQVTLAELDGPTSSTVFLRPSVLTGSITPPLIAVKTPRAADPANDTIQTKPAAVGCSNDIYQAGGYACTAVLNVASGTVPAESKVAFLRLTSLYNEASYRITLRNAANPNVVMFSDVQPSVDSTGRVGNLYRRVVSRLNYTDTVSTLLPSPNAAVDITANLCKDFYITDTTSNGKGCTTQLEP